MQRLKLTQSEHIVNPGSISPKNFSDALRILNPKYLNPESVLKSETHP